MASYSPPTDQVERVWVHLDYPYDGGNMFSAQIVWTPLPGVTEYQVVLQNLMLDHILVSGIFRNTTLSHIILGKSILFSH